MEAEKSTELKVVEFEVRKVLTYKKLKVEKDERYKVSKFVTFELVRRVGKLNNFNVEEIGQVEEVGRIENVERLQEFGELR